MGKEIIFTKSALVDLDEIEHYISLDSPTMAKRWIVKLLNAVNKLAAHPNAGRVVPELADPDIREAIKGNYRIIFRVHADRLEVLRVLHAARLLR